MNSAGIRGRLLALMLASAIALPAAALAQEDAADPHAGHNHPPGQHDAAPAAPVKNGLSDAARDALRSLIIQDFQGRMKPLDTLSREMSLKVTKRSRFQGWEPVDFYLSWMTDGAYWFRQPLIAVRHPGLKDMLGVSQETKHVSAASVLDERGQYKLGQQVEDALRTPDKDRSKTQRKLLSFDERVNLFFMSLRQGTLRIYPVPGDENNTWLAIEDLAERLDAGAMQEFRNANTELMTALGNRDDGAVIAAARLHETLQARYGAEVVPSSLALGSELYLNKTQPFLRVIMPYFVAFLLLLSAFVVSLARRGGESFSFRNPLYLIGSLVFWVALLWHLTAFVMRWVASGRAPLSNGYESLIWISLMVAVAGFIFELRDRKGLVAGLASLLTVIVLGVSLLSTFDPAIGPLVPVLASYWLNIHVTIITSSYGFLGLSALIAITMLVLHLFKKPGRDTVRDAIYRLNTVHWSVLVTGLGLLSVGTLLGGVWANESWGRYWGWDSKETWSLVTILAYAIVSHFRFIPAMNRPWTMAAGSMVAISSVIMTYFGVNYFLSGLHSYAAGDAATVPTWVYYAVLVAILLLIGSWWTDRSRDWQGGAKA